MGILNYVKTTANDKIRWNTENTVKILPEFNEYVVLLNMLKKLIL